MHGPDRALAWLRHQELLKDAGEGLSAAPVLLPEPRITERRRYALSLRYQIVTGRAAPGPDRPAPGPGTTAG